MPDPRRRPPGPDDDRFDVANRLFFRLYQASNLMHKLGTRSVTGFGSTTQQWAVLGALSRPVIGEAGMSVKELIQFLMLSRQNLAAVLDRLEARGWVARATDASDARSRRLRLTPEGRAEWDRMLVAIGSFYDASLKGFSADERLQLFRLLDRLTTGLAAADAEAPEA